MRSAYCSSSVIRRGLLGEEVADRAPDVFLAAEVAHADRAALRFQLAEDLGKLRLARPEGGDPAGLDVAGVVDQARERAERAARLVAILRRILAIGGVEEISVVAARVVALVEHVERKARDA